MVKRYEARAKQQGIAHRLRIATAAMCFVACGAPQKPTSHPPLQELRMESGSSHANIRWALRVAVGSRRLEGLAPSPEGPEQPPVQVSRELTEAELTPLVRFVDAARAGKVQRCSPAVDVVGGRSFIVATDSSGRRFVLGRGASGAADETCVDLSLEQHQELFRLFPSR